MTDTQDLYDRTKKLYKRSITHANNVPSMPVFEDYRDLLEELVKYMESQVGRPE